MALCEAVELAADHSLINSPSRKKKPTASARAVYSGLALRKYSDIVVEKAPATINKKGIAIAPFKRSLAHLATTNAGFFNNPLIVIFRITAKRPTPTVIALIIPALIEVILGTSQSYWDCGRLIFERAIYPRLSILATITSAKPLVAAIN